MISHQITKPNGIAFDETDVQAFRAGLRGAVLRAEEAGYDEARTIQNGLFDRHPALIARCRGAADVIDAVNFARERGLLVAVRGGGHNVAGNAVCDGGIVIDLTEMTSVHVDPRTRTVRVEGGATWATVDRETQVFGLATPGGNVSTTGVAGLTLHGGMGHLRRKHGLSIDNLLAVDIVTADGQLRTASATQNEDLFWAVRGAGSNFGVVTSFLFRLHPVGPIVTLCAPYYALEDAPAVLSGWRDFMENAPEDISSILVMWTIAPASGIPEELHGRMVLIPAAVHAGDVADGERTLQPLREIATPLMDASGQLPYTILQSIFDPAFPKGDRYYWKSLYVDQLGDELLGTLVQFAATRPSPRTLIAVWHQGGAMRQFGASETAFGPRDATCMISIDSTWTDPAETERNIAWTRATWAALREHSSGGLYLNFVGFGEEKEDLVRAAYGSNYARLAALKATYDPDNLFRMNQNIKPEHQQGI